MFVPIPHIINIDLASKINMNQSINIKKNDTNSHKFVINIFNNSVAYDLTGTTAKIYFQKSDDTKVFLDCILDVALTGRLSCLLTTQALSYAGLVASEITIYGTAGEILTSVTFNFTVSEVIRDDLAIESTSEFTALTNALAIVTNIALKADKTYVDSQDLLKADKTYVDSQDLLTSNKVGSLISLTTSNKTDLVNAINENVSALANNVQEVVDARGGFTVLNDRLDDSDISLNTLNYLDTSINIIDNVENLNRDSMWNIDPATLTNEAYHSRNVIMLGDSHMWGEGGSNYQGASSGSNAHIEWIHNDGAFGRLKKYIEKKWNSEPWRSIAELEYYDATINVFQTADAESVKVKTNKLKYTNSLIIEEGDFRLVNVTSDVPNALLNAKGRNDTYSITEYRHNSEIGLFGEYFLEFKPTITDTKVLAEIITPTRFVVVNLLTGALQGKAKIELLTDTDTTNTIKTTFGDNDYGTEIPVVYNGMINFSSGISEPLVVINAGNIIIDCVLFTGTNNFIIDFKQKKKGKIRMSHDTGSTNIIDTKGIITSNFDIIKNWSLGGHNTGAMIGTDSNWNNSETRDHTLDMVKYMYLPSDLIIFQAPIVNEWLKQVSLVTFKANLYTLLKNPPLNISGTADLIVFNTIGTKDSEFEGGESAITNEDYNNTLKEFCLETNTKFIDFRAYIKQLLDNTSLVYTDLYINNGHPSPFYNELIFKNLCNLIDMSI